jgi:hypothetical protein
MLLEIFADDPYHPVFFMLSMTFQVLCVALGCTGLPSLDPRKGQEKGKVG